MNAQEILDKLAVAIEGTIAGERLKIEAFKAHTSIWDAIKWAGIDAMVAEQVVKNWEGIEDFLRDGNPELEDDHMINQSAESRLAYLIEFYTRQEQSRIEDLIRLPMNRVDPEHRAELGVIQKEVTIYRRFLEIIRLES